ncbi:MAG: hypothetical protein Q9199_004579 [Rusavskia elegans]
MSRVAARSGHRFFALPVRRRPTYAPIGLKPPSQAQGQPLSNPFSTSPSQQQDDLTSSISEEPRWKVTPPRMRTGGAPNRAYRPEHAEFQVNEDPEKLDRAYIRVLGNDGDQLLTDEVKWLAVTHKSFDHGRRGFNDRLAYLGRRIVELQASLHMLAASTTTPEPIRPDELGREAFKHPALEGLAGLTQTRKQAVLDKKRTAQLADKYGLVSVMRWKPKLPGNFEGSGIDVILTQALYAIVGAISLQKGGEVANRIARERILAPLGLRG